jgi:glucan phosphoethanolaminetransferase (alkaline phosphatase superfamily)
VHSPSRREPDEKRKCPGAGVRHVILISLDTLRADHLSAYGYGKRTSPRIDALAAAGVRFETAIANSPETLMSHASLFTSLLPSAPSPFAESRSPTRSRKESAGAGSRSRRT